ncbi:MAG: 1-pyrroline-5-carboxylate dehydrogenase [Firmicutes bacterium ML8_F2]|nr:MAG: 1-pyrroline-5-carboxylate dehydrogenase [Firmicutes bacterium ML8_F2]
MNKVFTFEEPTNEAPLNYAPGSPEKQKLKGKLEELKKGVMEIPLIIGGKEVQTGRIEEIRAPHDHNLLLARYHRAGPDEIKIAIASALEAKQKWQKMPWEKRALIFREAAARLAGPFRQTLNAATMLGQGKNAYQAEIEAACELIDMLQFNTYFMGRIYSDQPLLTLDYVNSMEYRPLEGFIAAITPFNFTCIGANLATAPAMMGNVVLWKPASTAVYSNYFVMKLLMESGLPPGVINFLPASGSEIGDLLFEHPDLAAVHFTGSAPTLKYIWKKVGQNIDKYRSYPRIIGEAGGKDFVFAHQSANPDELTTALIRGAFEYQGQKCSAASRAYIPAGLWDRMGKDFLQKVESLKVGPVEDFRNFINPVIDRKAFDKIKGYIDYASESNEAEIIAGGHCDDSNGFYIHPTVIKTTNPHFKTMEEEIFGPVLTVYIYPEEQYMETLELCNRTSPYGLTGAVFSRDRDALMLAEEILTYAAGNFYINDKPTAAIIGQQPFGGSRASGTNDKAGSILNMIRWTTPRSIKQNLNPPVDYRYPFLEEE